MPGLVHSGNHSQSVQKTFNPGKPLTSMACSHVRARYPQAGPQSLGASEKAASR